MSRGASFAAFIDSGVEARGIIRDHIESFGLGGQTKLLKRDATNLGPLEKFKPFDLVFADPPYDKQLGEKALKSASNNGWISPNATIVLEEKKNVEIDLPEKFEPVDQRDYGDTTIAIFNYNSAG